MFCALCCLSSFNFLTKNKKELEAEIARFEAWEAKVTPKFSDPTYQPDYEEKRRAIRVLGVRVTVFPTKGEYPYRWHIDFTVPEVAKKLHCASIEPRIALQIDPTPNASAK